MKIAAFPRRPLGMLATAALLALSGSLVHAQGKTTLTVYTTYENEQLGPYKQAFEKDNPSITIAFLRDSPGIILARLIAEKDAPRADALWGVPSMHIMALNTLGIIQPYAPKGYKTLKPQFYDQADPPAWAGGEAWMSLICFNTVEAKKRGIPAPKTWSDLAKPVYQGQIAMPNPASSQTGYLSVNHWIQSMGEEKAWTFMDGLHANVAVYTHGGSKPCKMAATGEFVVGLSTDITGPQLKTKGAPIDVIVPEDKAGWDIEATAIMKGTTKLEAAKALADWNVTKQASEQYNRFMAIVAHPDVKNTPPNYPANAESSMAPDDVALAVRNQSRVLAEWTKRYDAKSEPKAN